MCKNVKFVMPQSREYRSFYFESPVGRLKLTGNEEALVALKRMDEGEDGDEKELPEWAMTVKNQLVDYFAGKRTEFELTVAPEGTPFQRKVWEALVSIPFGKTCSYLELSRELGDEKAIRAVGRANGRNPVFIIIPCHRVIGADGSLTGYAGGLEMKKSLLDLEARHSGNYQMALTF